MGLKKLQYYSTFAYLLPKIKVAVYVSTFFTVWIVLLSYCFPPLPSRISSSSPETLQSTSKQEHCDPDIAPFFIYDLPDRFNRELLNHCRDLNMFTDMCPHIAHSGLGQPMPEPVIVPNTDPSSWYSTNQFLAEMIFHARAERHPCRTCNINEAELFYVPFYGGFYTSFNFRQHNQTLRDAMAFDLAKYISQQSPWQRRNGHDHFLVLGRTSWDFMRKDANRDSGANKLLLLPETANMSVLVVERHPWNGKNQYGIPYPSYFHPKTSAEMEALQASARTAQRTHLYTFIGGLRPRLEKAAVRQEILRQCVTSERCLKIECPSNAPAKCHNAKNVLGVMRKSVFCMQPPGDSFTRRSVFDSVLAGCIPVFFSKHTAYTQYTWFNPPVRSEEWSVLLKPDMNSSIEEELDRIPKPDVEKMREHVISMIPSVTYAHPNSSRTELGFRDAVDIALVELTKMVQTAPDRKELH